jgi:hypothetical protein
MEEKIKRIDELMLLEEPTFEECIELDKLLIECTVLEEGDSELQL